MSVLRVGVLAGVITAVGACADLRADEAPPAGGRGSPSDEPFSRGSWALELTGSYMDPIRFYENHFFETNLALSYYVFPGHAARLEFQGYGVDQPNEDTAGVGLGLGGRWHFARREHFSLFLDGGGGVTYFENKVPEAGTHFNFTGKVGLGFTWHLRDNAHFVGGFRYWHLSNAHIEGVVRNPSFDSIQFYAGVMWTF